MPKIETVITHSPDYKDVESRYITYRDEVKTSDYLGNIFDDKLKSYVHAFRVTLENEMECAGERNTAA